ncbi:hypothetical protein RND81_12G213100 [Saponaria officinalis]
MEAMSFFKKILWRLPGPSKWKMLIWKIITDTLSVGAEFKKRSLNSDHLCLMCGTEDNLETIEHFFRDCDISKKIWAGSHLGIRGDIGRECSGKIWVINWLTFLVGKDSSQWCTLSFITSIWSIWCTRNDCLFQGMEVCFVKMMNHYNHVLDTAWKAWQCISTRLPAVCMWENSMDGVKMYEPVRFVGVNSSCRGLES